MTRNLCTINSACVSVWWRARKNCIAHHLVRRSSFCIATARLNDRIAGLAIAHEACALDLRCGRADAFDPLPMRAFLGRAPSDSNSSIPYLDFLLFLATAPAVCGIPTLLPHPP